MATSPKPIDRFKVVENPGVKPEVQDESYEAHLMKTVRKYYDLTKSSRHRRYYIWTISDFFARGLHWIRYNNMQATFTEWNQKDIDACLYTPVPRMQYAVATIAASYTSSNPRSLAVSPAQDIKTKAVVRQLQDYADYLDWEFYRANPDERQVEAMLIPLRGVYILVEYDFTQGKEYQVPEYGGEEKKTCLECGWEEGQEETDEAGSNSGNAFSDTEPNDAMGANGLSNVENAPAQTMGESGAVPPACPQCGSPNVQPLMLGLSSQGMKTARQGKPVRRIFDSLQVEIYDRRRDVDESPYLIADDVMFKTEALKAYPWLKAIDGQACLGNWNDGYAGLHYLYQLQTIVSNTGQLDQARPDYITDYGGAYLNDLLCWRRRSYLDADTYRNDVFERDTQLPGMEQVIPAGTRVIDVFPDGQCIHIMNNAKVVKVENVDKNAVWSMVKYRPASAGLHGVGVASLVSQNRQLDEANSFQMQSLLDAALGVTLMDERVKEVPNIPGRAYTVPLSARMPNEPLTNLATRIDTGGSTAIAAAEPLKQSITANMSDMAMASAPASSNLIPGTDRTATATRVQAGAVGVLTAPPLELYAANRAKVIGQAIELERKLNIQPRNYTPYGETTSRWFNPMEIPEDVRFVPADESWQPKTMDTKRDDVAGAIQLGVGNGSLNPAIEEKALQVFGLDSDTDDYEDWEIKAQKRLDAMKEALPAVQQELGQAQAMVVQAGVPEEAQMAGQMLEQEAPRRLIKLAQAAPNPMDKNEHFVRFYQEFYVTDDYDNSPPVLQQAVQTLWTMHQDAIAVRMAQDTQRAMVAQAPMQAQQQQQVQEQQGREDENADKSRAMDEQAKVTDHQRQMEAGNVKHEQAKEIEGIRAKARMQPKTQPSKKTRGGKK